MVRYVSKTTKLYKRFIRIRTNLLKMIFTCLHIVLKETLKKIQANVDGVRAGFDPTLPTPRSGAPRQGGPRALTRNYVGTSLLTMSRFSWFNFKNLLWMQPARAWRSFTVQFVVAIGLNILEFTERLDHTSLRAKATTCNIKTRRIWSP